MRRCVPAVTPTSYGLIRRRPRGRPQEGCCNQRQSTCVSLHAAAALVILALSACATKPPEPIVVTKEVKTEVHLPCAAKPIPRPEFLAPTLAALLALPDAAARYQALLSDVQLRIPYEAGLENVVAACGVK